MSIPDFSLREIRDTANLEERVYLPFEVVNVLTQVRKTFNGLAELAEAIHTHGQLHAGLGTILSEYSARQYLKIWNAIYQQSHTLTELTPIMLDGKKRYVILIAGERRYRSGMLARDYGPSPKFTGQYRIDLHYGLKAAQALELQIQENLHDSVPPAEEARAVRDLYLWHRHIAEEKDAQVISYAELGRRIGKKPEWISRALRFCNLPEALQRRADIPLNDGGFPYGMLVELARLQEGLSQETTEADLLMIASRAIAKRQSVKEFGEWVSRRLQATRTGQGSLFDGETEPEQRPIRKTVAPLMIKARLADNAYFKLLLKLYEEGAFGADNPLEPDLSPYSADSPARLTARLIESMQLAIPLLRETVVRNKRDILKVLDNASDALAEASTLAKAIAALEESSMT